MIFKYQVKHNGVIYPAGTNVPVEGAPEKVEQPEVKAAPVEEKPAAETKAKPRSKKRK